MGRERRAEVERRWAPASVSLERPQSSRGANRAPLMGAAWPATVTTNAIRAAWSYCGQQGGRVPTEEGAGEVSAGDHEYGWHQKPGAFAARLSVLEAAA